MMTAIRGPIQQNEWVENQVKVHYLVRLCRQGRCHFRIDFLNIHPLYPALTQQNQDKKCLRESPKQNTGSLRVLSKGGFGVKSYCFFQGNLLNTINTLSQTKYRQCEILQLLVNLHEGNCASNRSSMPLSKLTINTRFHRNYLTSMSASFTGGLRWGVGGSMSILSENIIHLIWLIGQFYSEQGFDIIREGVNTFLGMFT